MYGILRASLGSLIFFTLLLGGLYPAFVTVISTAMFPQERNGSLVAVKGKIIGSELIGQQFSAPKYFWGRLSATAPAPYNAAASTGSNLAASNPALLANAKARIAALKAADPQNTKPIPVDLITASGSGLDPHISPQAAYYQAARIARARGKTEKEINDTIARFTEERQFGIFGEPKVNVLKLNLALDGEKVDGE